MQVQLKGAQWEIGAILATGGFGAVYEAKSPNRDPAAAKFIPKEPGAKREMLFEDNLVGVRNVVPILDTGEDDDNWIIIMPRADHSLRDVLDKGPLTLDDARRVLEDLSDALADLMREGIVHRDLKPENVLWLNGSWCLADFGISRYAEAATAASTKKYRLTPQYAAPEQWRLETATTATDVYALGVMGFELLNGVRPFTGTDSELREAHLHSPVPPSNAPRKLGWLIEECLEKSPTSRPSPRDFRRRLNLSLKGESEAGLSALEIANQIEARNRAKLARLGSEAQTSAERRDALVMSAQNSFERISTEFLETLLDSAPAAKTIQGERGAWAVLLGEAKLALNSPKRVAPRKIDIDRQKLPGGRRVAAFDVVSATDIRLTCLTGEGRYTGRSHSLWYGDVETESRFGWYETAFQHRRLSLNWGEFPFAMPPGDNSWLAIETGKKIQHAFPFTPVDVFDLSKFVDRWALWFAAASQGRLKEPPKRPERWPTVSWRARLIGE